MSHDIFNASSTATWLECSWSALHPPPEPLKKQSTIDAAQAGTDAHAAMEAGEVPEIEAFVAQLEDPGATVREVRVKITDDCGGTLDLYSHGRRNWNVATILDGKFGKWDVPAMHNKQLFTYAAAMLKYSDADWWRFVIYQPNGLDEEPWKQWVHHRSEVEAHLARVLVAIKDRGPPKPGVHCRWCKSFQTCPAMSTDAGFVMGAMSRRIEDLTTDELVRLLRLIRALNDVRKVYESALETHLKMGRTSVLGAVLKPGRAWRAWNDPIQAATYLHQHYGAKAITPVSPAQAEKLGLAGKQYASVGAHKPPSELKASY